MKSGCSKEETIIEDVIPEAIHTIKAINGNRIITDSVTAALSYSPDRLDTTLLNYYSIPVKIGSKFVVHVNCTMTANTVKIYPVLSSL